jgi:hypothetical protein
MIFKALVIQSFSFKTSKEAIHHCIIPTITYIKTYQGWSYLASVLDLASRQVVGCITPL